MHVLWDGSSNSMGPDVFVRFLPLCELFKEVVDYSTGRVYKMTCLDALFDWVRKHFKLLCHFIEQQIQEELENET